MNDSPQKLHNRALSAMLSSAFFTWQSALIIALTIVLFGLSVPPFSATPFLWLLFGLVGEALYLFATITDPHAQRRALERMLSERYNPAHIKNAMARKRLEKALEYYSAMQELLLSRKGAGRQEFQNALDEVDDWIGELYTLGKRIDQFEENAIIARDLRQVQNELDALHRRLKAESDPSVQAEIQRSIEIKDAQRANLQGLGNNIKRADIQMDNTVAALGTVYAQMQLIGSKAIDRTSAQRLRNEIHDQVMSLQDTIATFDEIQHSAT